MNALELAHLMVKSDIKLLENNDLKIKNYRLNLFNSTFFLIISVKLNNVFLTTKKLIT